MNWYRAKPFVLAYAVGVIVLTMGGTVLGSLLASTGIVVGVHAGALGCGALIAAMNVGLIAYDSVGGTPSI